MSGFSVRIIQPSAAGLIGGAYAVLVLKHEFPGSVGAVVSSTTGIDGARRALQVAKDYRDQFGCGQSVAGAMS